jgi:hypothetical protein
MSSESIIKDKEPVAKEGINTFLLAVRRLLGNG